MGINQGAQRPHKVTTRSLSDPIGTILSQRFRNFPCGFILKLRCLNAEHEAPQGPRAGPRPGPLIMGPEPWCLDFNVGLRRLFLISKAQYIKNMEVPMEVHLVPFSSRESLCNLIDKMSKWYSGLGVFSLGALNELY